MSAFLGIDTSNYTTSAAIYDGESGAMLQQKQLLPVKAGELGVRQSDAVFHHTRQLPDMVEQVFASFHGSIDAIGVSDKPTQMPGSYMPCFMTGLGAARQLAAALHVPLFRFTHQQGHMAAAAFGAGCTELLSREFLAFHVSGGTTDALLVTPDEECVLRCERVGGSLDLKAGQLVDRVGKMLGLPFPAGPHLEALALQAAGSVRKRPKPVLKEGGCSLSGVENQCEKLIRQGGSASEVALFCLLSVLSALDELTEELLNRYPGRPVLYAGGVMSNSIIKAELEHRYGGRFSPPVFSSDNAAGIALLASMAFTKQERGNGSCA